MPPMVRPKRRYTVTAKVLAACRANLLKANAVSAKIRFRSTPRRRRACRANLLRAVAVLRTAEAPSRAYGACFRHGLYAVSLRRSAAMAGETQAEFDANLRRFERAFAPQDGVERKLVRAAARASWRRLRAFGGQANWELRSLEYRLAEAARGYPSDDFCPLTPADCDQILVEEVRGIFGTSLSLYNTLPKLSGRVERLLWALLERQTGQAPEFTWFTHRRASLESLLARPEAALDNALRSSGLVAEALGERPLAVLGTRQWAWRDLSPGLALEEKARLESEGTWRGMPGEGKALRYGLMRDWSVEAGRPRETPPQDAARQRFFELFEHAFNSSTDRSKNGSATMIVADGAESRSLPEVRAAAEAAWERLEVFRRQAQQEAERLEQVLEQAIAARAATGSLAGPADTRRELVAKILTAFAHHTQALGAALQLEEQLSGAFYKLLTARHGARPRFAHFDPSKGPKIEDALRPHWLDAVIYLAAGQESLGWRKSHSPPSSAGSSPSELENHTTARK